MRELPTYTPDFLGYTRMKEAGTDGFPYERHYGSDHSMTMSFEEHVSRQKACTPTSTPSSTPSSILENVTENVIEKVINVTENVGINVGIKEAKILQLIIGNPSISAAKIGEELGVTARQAERLLSALKKKQIIRRIGANKNGYWEIIK